MSWFWVYRLSVLCSVLLFVLFSLLYNRVNSNRKNWTSSLDSICRPWRKRVKIQRQLNKYLY